MSSRSSSMPPKTMTNSWKIESWDLPDLVFMIFSKPLILNDSTMNLMVFQVLGLPRTTRNPPKPSPGIILKLCIEMTPSKIEFLLEKGVPGPPKCHPKSMKNWPWTSKGPPWRSKGPQELAKASHGVKNDPKSSSQQPKHVENGHQAPVTSTGYRSRVALKNEVKGNILHCIIVGQRDSSVNETMWHTHTCFTLRKAHKVEECHHICIFGTRTKYGARHGTRYGARYNTTYSVFEKRFWRSAGP